MDYLFLDNLSGIPKNNKASSFYLVDKELRYVSFHDSELYYLSYVDCDKIHEIIKETDNEYELDYFVIEQCKPILSQECFFEVRKGETVRIVNTRTVTGNYVYKKPKEKKEGTIITRFSDKNKKLF